ncbi:MAG: DUF1778 domain-containing protein [Vicingaceae bacterium]
MKSQAHKDERIEIRVSARDKEIFKRAQIISGDKTFSSFIIRIVRKHAKEILLDQEKILASERDRKIFFDAIFSDIKPNKTLIAAAKKYKSKIG